MLTDHLSIIIGTNDQPKIIHILVVEFFFKNSKEKEKGWRNGRDGGGVEKGLHIDLTFYCSKPT